MHLLQSRSFLTFVCLAFLKQVYAINENNHHGHHGKFHRPTRVGSNVNATNSNPVMLPLQSSALGPLANVTIGTPPQSLTVLTDWTWMGFFARTANCEGSYDLAKCIPSGQEWYNERNSSTFVNVSDTYSPTGWYNTSFLPGGDFAVSFGEDTICMGEICHDNTVLQLSDFDIAIPEAIPFGGIFGLSPVLPGLNVTFYPASYQAYLDGQLSGQVGFHSCEGLGNKSTCEGGDMLTVLGGTAASNVFDPSKLEFFDVETESCVSEVAPVNIKPSRDNFWTVRWTGLWMGDSYVSLATSPNTTGCRDSLPLALLDEGSEGYKAPLPLSTITSLLDVVGAISLSESDAQASGYTYGFVSCPTSLDTFPSFTYELQGKKNYTVTPDTYVVNSKGSCFLNVEGWDLENVGPVALFGQAFFKYLYVVLDFEKLQVGLAPLNSALY